MGNTKKVDARGPGLTALLTIVFVVLKLTGVIAWSWAWVLSPLWIAGCLWLLFFLLLLVVIVVTRD